MKKLFKKMLMVALVLVMAVPAFTACDNEVWCNETTPLIMGINPVTGNFNPFTATSGVDHSIIGMTQMSLTQLNMAGDWVEFGEGFPVASRAFKVENINAQGQVIAYNDTNRYLGWTTNPAVEQTVSQVRFTFVLKNDIYFSDGQPLTLKDVFFNLYAYLDPSYIGPNQLHTVNIDGLAAYRSQDPTMTHVNQIAGASNLGDAIREVSDMMLELNRFIELEQHLGSVISMETLYNSINFHFNGREDRIEMLLREFREELEGVVNSGYVDVPEGHQFLYVGVPPADRRLATILHRLGIIRVGHPIGNPAGADILDPDNFLPGFRAIYTRATAYENWEPFVDAVEVAILGSLAHMPIFMHSQAAFALATHIAAEMGEDAAGEFQGVVRNIRGIRRITENRTIGGETFNPAVNEMFSITINGVDPSAIWSVTGVSLNPMHIYSGVFEEVDYRLPINWCWYGGETYCWEEFHRYNTRTPIEGREVNLEGEARFGLPFRRVAFHQGVIGAVDVPIGAGAYMASCINFTSHINSNGTPRRATRGEFFQGNTVFFYRNPFFTYGPGDDEFGLGGPARIHRLSMRVFSRAQIVASMEAGEFHYVMTDSMPRDQHPVQNSRTLAGVSLPNLGWGYVGINAGLIQDIRVRRAIMYVLNPDRTLAYYQGLSHRVTRATSRNNWVFWNPVTNVPEFPECRYPFAIYRERAGGGYELNPTGIANVMSLFEAAGYTREGATAGTGEFTGFQVGGRLVNPQGVQLRLTFTLPGDTLDHPARDMFLDAARYLEVLFGANTSVISDPLVLSRLATGQLQIWAAAFGGGIDPDMFGLFHMHSRNSIINAWGFSAISDQQAPQYGPGAIPIVAGSEDDQWALLQRLADEIIAGREVTGRAARTPRYITAHDTLMDLAVVLPTYERENMFIMNQRAIDMSTTYGNRPGEELSRFRGPLYNLPLLSFNI